MFALLIVVGFALVITYPTYKLVQAYREFKSALQEERAARAALKLAYKCTLETVLRLLQLNDIKSYNLIKGSVEDLMDILEKEARELLKK